ncbi:hypothetical protein TNCT_115691 [Trichonephila clavata]|uniref:Uncharacterized protein n=1 Tax=Trichonephila clavata TaxID=2740835 RepID=A0A8X6FP80_TRICU|nr:hypothetical protein TNCT_115691 [Trichonephila clavata]
MRMFTFNRSLVDEALVLLNLPFDALLFSPFPLHSVRLNSTLPPFVSSPKMFAFEKESLEPLVSPVTLRASLFVASPGATLSFAWGNTRPNDTCLQSFQGPGAMTPLTYTYDNHCKIGNTSRFTVITIDSIQSVE